MSENDLIRELATIGAELRAIREDVQELRQAIGAVGVNGARIEVIDARLSALERTPERVAALERAHAQVLALAAVIAAVVPWALSVLGLFR